MPKVKKELCFFLLFERFIKDSKTGRRLQPSGKKLSSGTIANYSSTLKLVRSFSRSKNFPMRIRPIKYLNAREFEVEKNYWKKFHKRFCDYLYIDCGHYDNYVGHCMKNIKVFINYLNKDLVLRTGDFHKLLYVRKEEIAIFPLMPEELNFLIYNRDFEGRLSPRLQEVKDFFVFGCTVALRFSDLIQLRKTSLRIINHHYYLSVRSKKTATDSIIKLPGHAVTILGKYQKQAKWLLPRFNRVNLNTYIKTLLEMAGFTHTVAVSRERRGVGIELKPRKAEHKGFRFCDVASTHTMRRTAITTMLSLGMTEQVVRKISGHSPSSKEFYRYTLWAQMYQDTETEKVFEKLKHRHLNLAEAGECKTLKPLS
jgi:integrase